MPVKPRLTEAALRERLTEIRNLYQLDPALGTAQLDGRNLNAIIAYGRCVGIVEILEDFNVVTE